MINYCSTPDIIADNINTHKIYVLEILNHIYNKEWNRSRHWLKSKCQLENGNSRKTEKLTRQLFVKHPLIIILKKFKFFLPYYIVIIKKSFNHIWTCNNYFILIKIIHIYMCEINDRFNVNLLNLTTHKKKNHYKNGSYIINSNTSWNRMMPRNFLQKIQWLASGLSLLKEERKRTR